MTKHHNTTEYWQERWENGQTGWDMGQVNQVLLHELHHGALRLQAGEYKRILIPGCGSGYEVEELARAGWSVTAVDIAPAPLQHIRQRIREEPDDVQKRISLVQADMLSADAQSLGEFDVIWEYTCYCAIPIEMRGRYAQALHSLLASQGQIHFLFFPIGAVSEQGPPFTVSEERDLAIFADLGLNIEKQAHQFSHPKRRERELLVRLSKQ